MIKFNYNNCLQIIDDKNLKSAFDNAMISAQAKAHEIHKNLDTATYRFLDVLNDDSAFAAIQKHAQQIRSTFKNLIVFGTGGSSLGGQALTDIHRSALGNLNSPTQVYFCENVDPKTFTSLFASVDLAATCFMFISKSGNTIETISQLLAAIRIFKDNNLEHQIKSNFQVITTPHASPIADIANQFGLITKPHDTIGGRFSLFSNVGLTPAAVAGIDIEKLRSAAKNVLNNPELHESAIMGAALSITFAGAGIGNTVLMPYFDCMRNLARWYAQLWAESVGKNGKGTTPVQAIGTVDQHSQLQLYLDGPADKFFTLIIPTESNDAVYFDNDIARKYPESTCLDGRSMGELLRAEAIATANCIIDGNKPIRTIETSTPDEDIIGRICVHYMLETVIGAHLLGVDAFNQPAVEAGKIITRSIIASQ